MVRTASLASLALLLTAPPVSGRAAGDVPKEPGVYWEQSVEMQMAGFSMPAQKQRVCLPKQGLQEPPRGGPDDSKCEMSDVKRTGPRMTWKMKCKDGSTGEGDITSGPDSFDGTMTMRTQGHEALMKMKGKKVGGDCDANEMKRKVAGMQKQAEESQAQAARSQAAMCDEGATKMELELFVPAYPGVPVACKDASKLCALAETRQGLVALRQHRGDDTRQKVEKLCKKDLDSVVEKLCAAAAKEQQKATRFSDEASMEFVFGYCPDLAKTLAKRECAGRRYTAMPQAQREFCTRWAQKNLEAGGAQPAREAPAAATGRYLESGIPDVGAADEKAAKAEKSKKGEKKSSDDDEDAPPKPKDQDMKSRIMKGIFGN